MTLLDFLPSQTITLGKDETTRRVNPPEKNLFSLIKDAIKQEFSSLTSRFRQKEDINGPENQVATGLVRDLEKREEIKPRATDTGKMAKAIQVYGGQNAPLQKFAPQLTKATEEFQFFKDNPHLLPVIAHLETSSGRNITRPNNLLNWGINFPGNNAIFAQMTPEQVLDRAITGLGERSKIYERFRTGKPLTDEELMDFAQTYEPANASYGRNLVNGIRFLESQL